MENIAQLLHIPVITKIKIEPKSKTVQYRQIYSQ